MAVEIAISLCALRGVLRASVPGLAVRQAVGLRLDFLLMTLAALTDCSEIDQFGHRVSLLAECVSAFQVRRRYGHF